MGAAFIPILVAVISTVASKVVSSAFAPSVPSTPEAPAIPSFAPPPEAPEPEDPAIQEKAKQEKLRRQRAAGLSSTVLTSGRGVAEDALTQTPTLLGK